MKQEFIQPAIQAALDAGKAILKIYQAPFDVEFKADRSPLTLADKNAHDIILDRMSATSVPVLSEEGKIVPFDERRHWSELWLVDPLDGTKEFIKRNGEFTVNIAFVENGRAVFGVIYQPVTDMLYYGGDQSGGFMLKGASVWNAEEIRHHSADLKSQPPPEKYTIIASRSHLSAETAHYIEAARKQYPDLECISSGSSLKLCLVAENKANVYPRFAPTMEWDTAAGHAILKSVGKNIYSQADAQELKYNKPDLRNDWFIAK